MIDIGLDGIEDTGIRENFSNILEEFKKTIHRFDFQFFEVVFTAAVTNYKFKHNMRFVPKDVIQTSVIGAGAVTFNYANFDSNFIDITTTGACTVRFIAGNFSKQSVT